MRGAKVDSKKTLNELSDEELREVAEGKRQGVSRLVVFNAKVLLQKRKDAENYYESDNIERISLFVRLLIKGGSESQRQNLARAFSGKEWKLILLMLQQKTLTEISEFALREGIYTVDTRRRCKFLLDQFMLFIWRNYHDEITELEVSASSVAVPLPPKETGNAQQLVKQRCVNRGIKFRETNDFFDEHDDEWTTPILLEEDVKPVDLDSLDLQEKWILGQMYLQTKLEHPNKGLIVVRPLYELGLTKEDLLLVAKKVGLMDHGSLHFPARLIDDPHMKEFSQIKKPNKDV